MKISTVILKDLAQVESIVHGDRSYIIEGVDSALQLGDFIHFAYVKNMCYIENDINSYIYAVSSIERRNHCTIVSFKKCMSWSVYVREILNKSHLDGYPCDIRFYGLDNCEHSLIRNFDEETLVILSKNHNPIHREIKDIVEINRIELEVVVRDTGY